MAIVGMSVAQYPAQSYDQSRHDPRLTYETLGPKDDKKIIA